ncbi:MAG: YceD family protein [Bacteroidales bacterium]
MKYTETYCIPYEGLSLGKHKYEYTLSNDFFLNHGTVDISTGDLLAIVVIDKHPSFIELSFEIEGSVELECGRCLDMYNQDLDYVGKLIVKFGDKDIDEGDDIVWIDKSEGILHLAKWLNEFVVLSLPIRRVHPDSQDGKSSCNEQMLAYLDNEIDASEKDDNVSDSRWDALKVLKDEVDKKQTK